MPTLIDAQLRAVTREIAAEWLRDNLFEFQRERRQRHQTFLAGEMSAGRFRAGTAIEFGVLDGKEYLVNGQHTLGAIEQSGVTIQLVIIRQQVTNKDELAHLYNTYDTGLSRSWTDAFAALSLTKRYNMTDKEVNVFGFASPYIAGNFGLATVTAANADRSRDLRVGVMETYYSAARMYFDCIKSAEQPIKKALMYPPIAALGIYSVEHDQERAVRFWTLAAEDERLAKTDPPKATTVLIQRKKKTDMKSKVALVQSVAALWNAYVLERQIRDKMISKASDSVKILRTPLEHRNQAELTLDLNNEEEMARNVELLAPLAAALKSTPTSPQA